MNNPLYRLVSTFIHRIVRLYRGLFMLLNFSGSPLLPWIIHFAQFQW